MVRPSSRAAGPRVTVVGTGYLGVTHAAALAEWGCEVLGVDVDPAKVEALTGGRAPFFEPGLDELLARHVRTGRLRFTTSPAEAGAWGEVHFVCVGTPPLPGAGAADLRHVRAACHGLAPHLVPGAVVVGKSTVPVGADAELRAVLSAEAPADVELAWNPEFLREGHAVADSLHPDRLVFGVGPGGVAEKALRGVYQRVIDEGVPVVVTDPATAQLIKVAANAFLATKISFVNAMAEICEATGADVTTLAEAMGHDARIGRHFLDAGLGFGGGCLPKDLRSLAAQADQLGAGRVVALLRDVEAVNLHRRRHVVELTRALCGGRLAGRRIAALGLAFKPGSDDVRDSPALDVAERLRRAGADVVAFDPEAGATAASAAPGLRLAAGVAGAVAGAEVVLLLTEWPSFRELDPEWVGARVARRVVVDARNALDREAWAAAGWAVHGLGR